MSQVIVSTRGQAAAKRKTTKVKKMKKKEKEKEMTRLGAMLRYLGAGAGATLGGYAGYPVQGGAVGHSLGAALSKWLGAGDYKVGFNTLTSGDIPAMHNTGQSIIVRHKEFVTELTGSQLFTVQKQVTLNPGLSNSFPWLSTIASSYSEYRIRGMVFHYIPSSGTAVGSTNTALGTVMFQTTYRSSDNPPASKVEMLNEYCSNEAVPCDTLCHPIECDPKENPFRVQYVRSSAPPAGDSKLLYDLGTTTIATSGMQVDGKTIGDVWVTYEVELKKPILVSNVSSSPSQYFQFNSNSFSNLFRLITPMPAGTVTCTGADNKFTFPAVAGKAYTVILMFKFENPTSAGFAQSAVNATGGTIFTPATPGILPNNWNALATTWTNLQSGNCVVSMTNVRAGSDSITMEYTWTGSGLGSFSAGIGYGAVIENTF